MSDLHFDFSSVKIPALPPLWSSPLILTGWRFAAAVVWIILVVIGGINLALRVFPNTPTLPNRQTLAVGPGFSVLQSTGASSTIEAIIPARLLIPSIQVDAEIEKVGARNGMMEAPRSYKTVGWYKDGGRPGGAGHAVFDGHVNNVLTSAGVFEHLDQVRLGDQIIIYGQEGGLIYRIDRLEVYAVDHAPVEEIFTPTGPSRVVLITCDGAWDQGKKTFDKRLVIYASLEGAA